METEGKFVPMQELGYTELAEQLGAMEDRFAKKVSDDMAESELEMLGGKMSEDIERLYNGNDMLLGVAPEILKHRSDLPDVNEELKIVLISAANTLLDNNKKRGVFPGLRKAA